MNTTKTQPTVTGRVKVAYPRLQRILVPLDFTGKSRQALRYAVPQAQKFNARIALLHVLAPVAKGADAQEARRAALKRLVTTGSQLIPTDLHHDNIVLSGDPATQILKVAKHRDMDLIVLATKSIADKKRRLLSGGTADTVIREAPCPVLTVRRT